MHEPRRSNRKNSTLNENEHKKRKHLKSSSKPEFDDAQLFCDDCSDFYDNICPYHKQLYVPDTKVNFSSE